MPNRVQWVAAYSMGDDTLDSQHQAMLAQCNFLADCLDDAGAPGEQRFDAAFTALMVQAREHFATEAALLRQCAYPLLDAHLSEYEEFDYLVRDIITTENFEKVELQRFLALWWVGHMAGSARPYRSFIDSLPASDR